MHPILNIAIRAIRQPCNFIMKNFDNKLNNSLLKNDIYINNFLIKIEKLIFRIIKNVYPKHNVTRDLNMISNKYAVNWVVNSIDGIENFVNHFPHFSTSIIVIINGKTEIIVIYDYIRNELFTAVKGRGAKMGNYRLRINNKLKYHDCILCTNIIFDYKKENLNFNSYKEILNTRFNFRYTGSNILDFAYLAAGRIHGIFINKLKLYEIFLGELLIRESGGLITDFNGCGDYINSRNIIAGCPKMVKMILSFIKNKNK